MRRTQGKEALRAIFRDAISDMVLTPHEIQLLRSEVAAHGLSADDVREVGTAVLTDAVVFAKADGLVTDTDMKTINDIVALTQVSSTTVGELIGTMKLQRKMYELTRGVITPLTDAGIQLRAGELA
jgi:hypothetical protein